MAINTERLPPQSQQFDELLRWIDETAPGQLTSVLDVGGGGQFYDFPTHLRNRALRIVGVDPDPGVLERPWLDESHQMLLEEYMPVAEERFDLALCIYVIEHVEAPGPFLEAMGALLKPGASCFGITPNLLHYFGMASALAAKTGMENHLLHLIRHEELIEAYHSPVRYRCNTTRRIHTTALAAGFNQVEFKVLEQPGMFETYLPRPLRWWPKTYSNAVNRWGAAGLFGTLLFRLTV